ncbi:regulatory protein GemA [Hansschlegelia zhihuaiae]|uniref:Regulatory protein GemA n=1 Tax=Hansschlegelia zhihuaiae TaxID=405005 RepID=A0A4Q0MMS8_9HYPH|nr:regulatory protein GemA [Hansschlegelia zhihuaiae]RXF75058.1 regulatory protein GemA [Hansschlegelia zhihuaiae]
MTQPASGGQIRMIHKLARQAGLDEDMRRDLMERETGKRSVKELDIRGAIKVIDRLQELPQARESRARGALKLDGPYAGKIRALWISGWHLGVVHDRSDTAMVAFVERQTRIQNLAWLRDPADARKVVEALKSWLSRKAEVAWGDEDASGLGAKRAVYLAIRRALTPLGVDPNQVEFPGRYGLPRGATDLDELIKRAGARLRQARAAKSGGA